MRDIDHHGRRGRRRDREHDDRPNGHHKSPQTFRRGRAIAFLENLNVKRSTLTKQLSQPEFESIKPVICGELKAVDAILQEFVQTFELQEATTEKLNEEDEKNERN